MIVRKFILRNSIGDYIDFLDNLDIFAISPEGLGVDFTNDLVDSGASFLIDKRGYETAKVTFTVLLGAEATEPYRAFERLVEVLSKPPYTLEYVTPVGTWERSCIPSSITKGEIGQLNILSEQFTVECLTPWYRWKEDRAQPPEDQKGDGKIYSKHTNWKYPDNAFKTPPLTYTAKDFWDYDDTQSYINKNIIDKADRNIHMRITPGASSRSALFLPIKSLNPNRAGVKMGVLVDNTENEYTASIFFNIMTPDGNSVVRSAGQEVPAGEKRYVKLVLPKGAEVVGQLYNIRAKINNSGTGTRHIGLSNFNICEYGNPDYYTLTEENSYSLNDKLNTNTMVDYERTRYEMYATSDGVDDAKKFYNVVPSIYPEVYSYIYNATYVLDYTFKNWEVEHSVLQIEDVKAVRGADSIFGISIDNFNSDDGVKVRVEARDLTNKVIKTYYSGVVQKDEGNIIEMKDIKFSDGVTNLRVVIMKANQTPGVKMNVSVGGMYWYTNYKTKGRFVSTIGNNHIDPTNWVVADDKTRVEDGVFYGYIYDYIYDAQEQSGNSFVISNESQYMNDKVRSPLEITIHGPAKKPRWEVIEDGAIVQTDGFNLDVPEGYRLIVSSVPNEQRAVLVDPYGVESNVYQQQNLTMTNFVKLSSGTSILVFYGTENVTYRYREERVVV